jgi:preprotein translocase subunit SecD
MDFDANGMPVLDIALSPIAGERLSVMTGQQIGRTLDMRLDDQLIDQVVIVEAITQGKLRLSGRFAVADIKRLMRDMACKLQLSKDIALGLSAKERKCPKGNVGNSGKPTAE